MVHAPLFACRLPHGLTYALGKLSSSILEGIISSFSDHALNFAPPPEEGKISKPPPVQPSSLTACVHQQESADKLKEKFEKSGKVDVLANENVRGVKEGAIILLGVEPNLCEDVLAAEGMRDALANKILVSLVGGVSIAKLKKAIYGVNASAKLDKEKQCQIIRVTPSTASAVRDSVSLIIQEGDEHYPPSTLNPVYSLFMRVGSVKVWPDSLAGIGGSLCASSPAFFSLLLEGAVDTAVELGIERTEALNMAAAAMRGAAALITSGEEPSEVRRKIATPGGSTEAGLKVLEEGGAKDLVSQALKKTSTATGSLGDKKAAEEE